MLSCFASQILTLHLASKSPNITLEHFRVHSRLRRSESPTRNLRLLAQRVSGSRRSVDECCGALGHKLFKQATLHRLNPNTSQNSNQPLRNLLYLLACLALRLLLAGQGVVVRRACLRQLKQLGFKGLTMKAKRLFLP